MSGWQRLLLQRAFAALGACSVLFVLVMWLGVAAGLVPLIDALVITATGTVAGAMAAVIGDPW